VKGGHACLNRRGIEIVADSAIARADARRLFDEHRENEARRAERRAAAEKAAVEADREWRSQLPHGVPWYQIPDGVLPVTAADRDLRPSVHTALLEQELAGRHQLEYVSLGPGRGGGVSLYATEKMPSPYVVVAVVVNDLPSRSLGVRLSDTAGGYERSCWKQAWSQLKAGWEDGWRNHPHVRASAPGARDVAIVHPADFQMLQVSFHLVPPPTRD
jgi:hypothetical protein